MKSLIINHLSGSKANQTESFELPIQELLFGRAPNCQIKFDPEKDDLVSREHCKITVQENDQFFLTDLGSKNGTFVNGQKLISPKQINAGDNIQLGKDGPHFIFDLNPRPEAKAKETRFGDSPNDIPFTREHRTHSEARSGDQATKDQVKPGIGRNTVERLITDAESETRKKMINIGSGIIGIVLLLSGYFYYQNLQDKSEMDAKISQIPESLEPSLAKINENQPMPAAEIFKNFVNSTVMIEASWKLIHIPTGKQIFQKKDCLPDKKGKCATEKLPWFVYFNGTIEPFLEFDSGIPIGSSGKGSGFVVEKDGYILTNRHVAASWHTQFGNFKFPGILVICDNDRCEHPKIVKVDERTGNEYLGALKNYIPSKAKFFGDKPLEGKLIEGRNDYLEVTFPKTQLRAPAHLVRVSDTADVALIKIDVPEDLHPVEMDAETAMNAGDPITVMGYPGISPDAAVKMYSQDPLNREGEWRTIPDPTVTPGAIGKVITGKADPVSDSVSGYYSEMGDVYQLTVNATGAGNSGGPVFSGKGKVVGIFTYGKTDMGGTNITFAVPVKHGLEIMGIHKVIQ